MTAADFEDDEWVEDSGDDDEDDLLVCPGCRGAVHEETQKCPHCGDWIIPVSSARPARRILWIACVALLVLVFLLGVLL